MFTHANEKAPSHFVVLGRSEVNAGLGMFKVPCLSKRVFVGKLE